MKASTILVLGFIALALIAVRMDSSMAVGLAVLSIVSGAVFRIMEDDK